MMLRGPYALATIANAKIKPDDVYLIQRYGTVVQSRGREYFFLRRRDLPEFVARQHSNLIGTVLVCTNGLLLNAVRGCRLATIKQLKRRRRRK